MAHDVEPLPAADTDPPAPAPAVPETGGASPPYKAAPRTGRRLGATWLVIAALLAAGGIWAARWALRPDAARLRRQAVSLLERGRAAESRVLLDRLLWWYPRDFEARILRGQAARELKEVPPALDDWRAVPDAEPRWASVARYLEALVLLEEGRSRAAEDLLRRAVELRPEYLPAHERLLQLLVLQMRRDDTRRALLEIRKRRAWTLEELVLFAVAGDRLIPAAEAVPRLDQFLAADPADAASACARAEYHFAADEHDAALELLRRTMHAAPEESVAAAGASLALAQDKVGAAREFLVAAPSLPASGAAMWRACGQYWLALEDWERAVECLAVVVEQLPDDLASRHQYGQALQRLGRTEAAAAVLRSAETLDFMQRQALRLPRRDRRRPELIAPIIYDTAAALARLGRKAEAQLWAQYAAQIEPLPASLRDELEPLLASPALEIAWKGEEPQPLEARLRPLAARPAGTAEGQPAAVQVASAIRLRDDHLRAGLEFQYFSGQTGLKYLVESMGGAVAVLDFDRDGWPDLYFPQGCRLPFSLDNDNPLDRLFRNRGDGTYEDVTEASTIVEPWYGQGVTAGDLDGDGFQEIVVANMGRVTVLRNHGDGTFSDVTEAAGVRIEKWASSLALADLDRDGDLDLYVVTYVDSLRVCRSDDQTIHTCDPQNFQAEQDFLLLNNGDGTFTDISARAGIHAPEGKGLGIVICDLDDDGWPDIYIANDGTPNFLFRNLGAAGEPRFAEAGAASGTSVDRGGRSEAGMGIACADLNGDQRFDLLTTNFYLETVTLYLNRGGMLFQDETRPCGLDLPTKYTLGFGTQAVDFDLDGDPDLFVANGHIDDSRSRGIPWKMPPQLFENLGHGRFAEISTQAGAYFEGEYLGRGVAWLDAGGDGRPDLVVVHQDRPASLLTNSTGETGRSLRVEPIGTDSNRDAIGAVVTVTSGGKRQRQVLAGGNGFFAKNEAVLYFGLGGETAAEAVEVAWPNGRVERWHNVSADRKLRLIEGRGE